MKLFSCTSREATGFVQAVSSPETDHRWYVLFGSNPIEVGSSLQKHLNAIPMGKDTAVAHIAKADLVIRPPRLLLEQETETTELSLVFVRLEKDETLVVVGGSVVAEGARCLETGEEIEEKMVVLPPGGRVIIEGNTKAIFRYNGTGLVREDNCCDYDLESKTII